MLGVDLGFYSRRLQLVHHYYSIRFIVCPPINVPTLSQKISPPPTTSKLRPCTKALKAREKKKMHAVETALEMSGVEFLWVVEEPMVPDMKANYDLRLSRFFEDREAKKGLVGSGSVPNVTVLGHPAVGAVLTHCGWNSVLEAVTCGVIVLTWPCGVDQFANETLLVEELRIGKKACEGPQSVLNPDELARVLKESVSRKNRIKKNKKGE